MPKLITVNGRTFTIQGRDGDPYFDHLNVEGGANEFLFYTASRFVREGDVVFDVGANIGVTTCALSAAAGSGTVYSFEPGPETYALLTQTIATNGLSNVRAQQLALAATAGTLDFLANPVSGSASHLAPASRALGGSNLQVQVRTLDEFAASNGLNRIDLIKIDVEGFELDVLQGAAAILATRQSKVFLEFNSYTLIAFGNQNPRAVLEFLTGTFPNVYRLIEGQLVAISSDTDRLRFIHDNLIRNGCVDDLLCSFEQLT